MITIREGCLPFAVRGQVIGSEEVTPEMEDAVDVILALPWPAQLSVLRTLAPLVLARIDELDQEAFLEELRKELDRAEAGDNAVGPELTPQLE